MTFIVISIFFRNDQEIDGNIVKTVTELIKGLREIWFRFYPGALTVPLSLAFLIYIVADGGTFESENIKNQSFKIIMFQSRFHLQIC